MATYVNNLRLKEIATGDESGTWGTSTNTNLELVGEALGFGTEAITTNANTHASTGQMARQMKPEQCILSTQVIQTLTVR